MHTVKRIRAHTKNNTLTLDVVGKVDKAYINSVQLNVNDLEKEMRRTERLIMLERRN